MTIEVVTLKTADSLHIAANKATTNEASMYIHIR